MFDEAAIGSNWIVKFCDNLLAHIGFEMSRGSVGSGGLTVELRF